MIIKRNSLVAHENTFADLLSILETFFNNENQKLVFNIFKFFFTFLI